VVEGKEAAENERARGAAVGAINEIAGMMDQLPKPVERPPQLFVLPASSFAREKVLLWSLGVEVDRPDEAHVAVLYGRGRRMGPLLSGKGITKERISNLLGIVGASCECGLDRSWMQGPMFPLVWGEDLQSAVVKQGGFDAESPLVKTEISRILAMGRRAGLGGAGGNGSEEDGFLGYTEQIVAFENDSGAEETAPTLAPAQVRELDLPKPASDEIISEVPPESDRSFQVAYVTVGGMVLVVLAGGGLVIVRARRRAL
jgi:hypothetical protein